MVEFTGSGKIHTAAGQTVSSWTMVIQIAQATGIHRTTVYGYLSRELT